MAQKFHKDMTFAQFLYANYGFSYTREQARTASAEYLKLYCQAKEALNKIS